MSLALASTVLALVLVLAVLTSPPVSAHVVREEGDAHKQVYFDFFVMSMLWPGTVLGGRASPSHEIYNFTLHGLWPSYENASAPFTCSAEEFSEKAIEPIMHAMELLWPMLWVPTKGDKDNNAFWSHEWSKHGTCAATLEFMDSQLKYFSQTLALSRATPLLQTLAHAAIVPSHDRTYKLDALRAAFSDAGYDALFLCQAAPAADGTPQLVSIELCVDKSLRHITCSKAMHEQVDKWGGCDSDEIAFPPVVYSV